MDAGCPGELSDPHNRVFDIARGDHHQVGELIDYDQQIRVRLELALAPRRKDDLLRDHCSVEVVDVAKPETGQVVITQVHLFDDPGKCFRGLLRVRDDGRDEVGDAGVWSEFDALWVDQHHAHVGWRRPHQQRNDHRVHETRLAGPGGTRHQEVGHLREVGHHKPAFDVFAEADGHRMLAARARLGSQDIPQRDDFAIDVRDLDSDCALTRDGRQDANLIARDRV